MGVAKAALEASVRYLAYRPGAERHFASNAISAGPSRRLPREPSQGLGDMLKAHADRAPLKRNVDPGEVGGTAAFLLPTQVRASPAKRFTSIAATTSWVI